MINFFKITKENNFYYLFYSLVVLLITASVMDNTDSHIMHNVFSVLMVLIFFVEIKSLRHQSSWKSVVYILAVIIIVLVLSRNHINPLFAEYIHHAVFLIFFVKSFSILLQQIFSSDKITTNMLIGSVAGFLQLGLIWSFSYLLLLTYNPEAFNGLHYQHWTSSFSEVSYFSFVTLTTLGFGDISPKTPTGQILVYSEAIAGVFYMAIIVSTIVSAKLNDANKDKT